MRVTPPARARRAFAAQALGKPLRALLGGIAGVRRGDDREHVHKLRVASRRLRNVLDLFNEEWPPRRRKAWRRRIKRVTGALGAARDLDVQIEFVEGFVAALTAPQRSTLPVGLEYLLGRLRARRETLQADVLRALDRLESNGVLSSMSRWVRSAAPRGRAQPGGPALRREAGSMILNRLAGVLTWEPYIAQPECAEQLHALRIAAKHLRYTMEILNPLFEDALADRIEWAKRIQDTLGEIHDCDVWAAELPPLLDEVRDAQGASSALVPGLEYLLGERRARREQLYHEFVAGWVYSDDTRWWAEFRRPFEAPVPAKPSDTPAPAGAADAADRAWRDDPRLRPVLAFAEACRYEAGHSQQVTRLALRLFDDLAGLHGLGATARFWLTAGGLLHDIGWMAGRAGHHKTALRAILETEQLEWSPRLRRIIGSIARYHRGAPPSMKHAAFAALAPRDRAAVRKLAAILRVADALDYTHCGVVRDVRCIVGAQRLVLACDVAQNADEERHRAAEKGDLAAGVFERKLSIRCRPHAPRPAKRS